MQRGSFMSIAVRPSDDFNILIEFYEKAQKPFNRKLPELAAQHFGNVGLANAKQRGSFCLFHAALFHDRIDLEYQLRLD
jgi:hypothetical protein